MACKCVQKKKEPAGGAGNFKYTFECTNNGKKCSIEVTAANDNEAKQLAKLQCEEECK
ncbi:hypothetical protein L0244_39085 [bacterium]|nr:hypothetical protein [bacterium]